MYGFFGLKKKIEHPKLCKSDGKLCTLDVRIVCICRKIEYLELCKFNGKLCTLYVQIFMIYEKKMNSADTLNAQNCVNLTGNCVH